MNPDFTWLLLTSVFFSLMVLLFLFWRFGGANALAFLIVAGAFPALMDFISSFWAQNYVYPGQSRQWVFTYIFFGWMTVCGTCMLIAEGILTRSKAKDLLTEPELWWQVPIATAAIAVLLDLFLDPIAVGAGIWVWLVPGSSYYGIPLLNFVGWFVLMLLAPFGWLIIARREGGYLRKGALASLALVPLCVASVALSIILNGVFQVVGAQ